MFYGITASRFGGSPQERTYLATINGKPIDNDLFIEMVTQMSSQRGTDLRPEETLELQYEALEQTIRKTILLKEAQEERIKVTGQEVDIAISQIMESNKITAIEELEAGLKQRGQNLKKFKDMLKDEIRIQKLTNSVLSDSALTENDFKEIKLRHIYIKTDPGMSSAKAKNRREKAESILKQLKEGANFADLASKFSEDIFSKQKGGSLGYITTGMLEKAVEDAAFALKPGEFSEIIETDSGFYIVKVEDKRLRESPDPNKDIRTYLLDKKQGKSYEAWQKDLDNKYKVEIGNTIMRALQAKARGDLKLAIEKLLAAAKENPGNPYIHVLIGDVQKKLGKPKLALLSYAKAAEIGPGDPDLHIKAGKAYQQQGQNSNALKEFKKAALIAGDNLELHEEMLAIYQDMNAWNEISAEKKEIARIKKKQEFEDEMRKKADELLPPTDEALE
jgi:parvulin-like peptidyl-prolyl isomerase